MSAPPLAEAPIARLREIGDVVTLVPGEPLVVFGTPNEAFLYILDGDAAAWDEVTGTR